MMKTMILFITMISLSSCKCPPSAVEPKDIAFSFSIIDEEGNDLFFGKDAIYDPKNVRFTEDQGENWRNVEIVEKNVGLHRVKCFNLGGYYSPFVFFIEFIPNKIDTIKTESHITGYYDKRCANLPIFTYDVFFNNIPICIDYSYSEIYKIVLK